MTERLYDIKPDIKKFIAKVISCQECGSAFNIVLDKTAFFPESGGQGCDKGYIEKAKVLDVQIKDGIIIHTTNESFSVGTEVRCEIDWQRRFDFMQQHSAEHIVSGVANSLYGCENVGFHLSEEIVTFDFDKPLTPEQISQLEQLSNQVVFRNVRFNAYYPEAHILKNLKYRSKKELTDNVRIVEIQDVDICACCAPHVSTAGEIGIIKLLGREKIRNGVRIELKAGKRALDDYNEKYENILKISNLLCVKQGQTADAVSGLLEQISNLKFEITGIKRKLIIDRAEKFEAKNEITVEFIDGFDNKEKQIYADMIYKKHSGIRAVMSKEKQGFDFVICGEEKPLQEFFVDLKTTFNVRGGGRNGMVQGSISASKEAISEFFIKK